MKLKIFLFTAIFVFSFFIHSVERKKATPLSELTNINGKFYMPIPYPKTREDIITDMNYMLSKLVKNNIPLYGSPTIDQNYDTSILVSKYLNGKENFSVGKIVKVLNFSKDFNYEFHYLIELIGPGDESHMRVTLKDSGELISTGVVKGNGYLKLNEEFDLKNNVMNRLLEIAQSHSVSRQELNDAEYVFYPGISNDTNPARRVIKDGEMCIVSPIMKFYRVKRVGTDQHKELRKRANANDYAFYIGDQVMLVDTINEQIYSLDEVK